MIAYKLLRKRKNGTLAPLFINKTMTIPVGEWLEAEDHPTPGYAHRPGWHTLLQPVAPHLSEKDRVWAMVEIEDYEFFHRPENQGGKWALAQKMRVLEVWQ